MTNTKTHLQHLQDQFSSAEGLRVEYATKVHRLRKEIAAEKWRIKGFHIGDLVSVGGKTAVISNLEDEYWPVGRFLKKNGEPGGVERNLYGGLKCGDVNDK